MKNMQLFVRLVGVLTTLLFLAWILKIHRYYFDLDTADKAGLTFVASISFGIGIFLKVKIPQWLRVTVVVIVVLTSYFLISEAVLMISSAWYLTYLLTFIIAIFLAGIDSSTKSFLPLIAAILVWTLPFSFLDGQSRYNEKLIEVHETRNGLLEITQWKNDFWYYYNGELQFSSLDGHMYGEAAVHPAMSTLEGQGKVLVIGGENGLVSKELEKYEQLDWQLIPFDQTYADFMHAQQKVPMRNAISITPDQFLTKVENEFDLIVLDIYNLQSLQSADFYTTSFFQVCSNALNAKGKLVISTGDVHFDPSLLLKTKDALAKTDFNYRSYNAQIPTIGQWSWVLASKTPIETTDFVWLNVETQWYNQEALQMMLEAPQITELMR